jgi:predicted TIM-barrel fold metal-dependent hydrolase
MVSLDGIPGEGLDLHIKEYVNKYPGYFSVFTRIDYDKVEEPGFGSWVDKHLGSYVGKGVTGIKIPKNLGLKIKMKDGKYLKPDDDRLIPLWEGAAKYNIPVLIHIADPISFFDKVIDGTHERYDELAEHPDWSYGNSDCPRFRELLDCQENMLRKNPNTRFIIAHVCSYVENLREAGRMLDTYPNMYTDTAERIAELGRQPYSARDFLIKYQDRVIYGTDLVPNVTNISGNYRFYETKDEYFPYNSWDEHNQGRWNIYGVYLPDDVLKKIYFENALKVIPGIKKMIGA